MFNTRLYVISFSIQIEELISRTLATFLSINDWKKSNSLGYKSTSLSFNQKVYIIQDLKGIDSQMNKKLICLMQIRNKFAHIAEVDSFNKLFSVIPNGNDVKKELDKWYSELINDTNHDEEKFEAYFYLLMQDIANWLYKMTMRHAEELGYDEEGKKEIFQNDYKDLILETFKHDIYNSLKRILK